MDSNAIAKLAGVSRSTVSRVINGYANVPPATRAKVMAVIDQYGYEPNRAARNLAGKPTRTIGMFMIDLDTGNRDIIQSSPFFSEFLIHAADKLQEREYLLLVSVVRNRAQLKNLPGMFSAQTISGAILMGDTIPLHVLKDLSSPKAGPYLLVNQRETAPLPGILVLNTENYQGAYEAVSLLVRNGHKRIAHIGGPLDKDSTRHRYEGYRDCLVHNKIPYDERLVVLNKNIHRQESGYASAVTIFSDTENRPTALFCGNDIMALGAMRALGDLGLRIPGDVSVIGHDNTESSRLSVPPLSTVATSVDVLAEMAVAGLYEYIENNNRDAQELKLSTFEVIVRESVARLAPAAS